MSRDFGGPSPEEMGIKSEETFIDEQKAQKQELTPQEKTDLALKETVKVFKEALNPKSAVKKAKDFFWK